MVSIKKLERFLYGSQFVLQTDHKPLAFIKDSQMKNGRITRWALSLQPYRFTVKSIKGKDNIGSDLTEWYFYLSIIETKRVTDT